MPIFASVYQPKPHQRAYLNQQQQQHHHRPRNKKRKHPDGTSSEEDAQLSSSPPAPSRPLHPITTTDPYHIAGLSRTTDTLPPPPFPHAPVKDPKKAHRPLQEDLVSLNPPLYLPPALRDDRVSSLNRRHLDNLTLILHQSLLRGDYARAARAWGIIIRVEDRGKAVDIRRHGRWGIAAEILLRGGGGGVDSAEEGLSPFSERAFLRAREYYERLILQFPHTQYSKHGVNATEFYPAMLGVWVYGVQERSRREREEVRRSGEGGEDSTMSIDSVSDRFREVGKIRATELEQALPIAKRLDELLLSPPYDSDATLLELRGSVGLWIADLHDAVAKQASEDEADTSLGSEDATSPTFRNAAEQHRSSARSERDKARDIFTSLRNQGHRLPEALTNFIGDTSTNTSIVSPPPPPPPPRPRQAFSSYPDENYS